MLRLLFRWYWVLDYVHMVLFLNPVELVQILDQILFIHFLNIRDFSLTFFGFFLVALRWLSFLLDFGSLIQGSHCSLPCRLLRILNKVIFLNFYRYWIFPILDQNFLRYAFCRDNGWRLSPRIAVHARGSDAWIFGFDLVKLDSFSIRYEILPFYFLLLVE